MDTYLHDVFNDTMLDDYKTKSYALLQTRYLGLF